MKKKSFKGHIAIVVTNIIFGLNTPVSKNVLQEYLSPYSLTFFRMAGACAIFWLASFVLKQEKVKPKDLFFIFLASMFGIFINQFSFVHGLSITSPTNAALIVTVTPILTMLVSFLFLKEPITAKKASGVFMGALGAVLLIVTSRAGQISGNIRGDIFCFFSSLSYAIYLTAFKWLVDRYHPITLMKWMFLFATIVSLSFCYDSVAQINYSEIPTIGYFEIGYIVVMSTFITYLLIPIGQKILRPTVLTMYNYLQPIITAGIAIFFGMDTFNYFKVLSAILIFSGVYFTIKSKSRAQLEAEK
ncbi:MAG: DMT family transporter [Lentimicrobiaceae bacterium]|jgi:drug/metabolite transporter (DMT)-like permease|nr:DMT family transporter [Lentimicrobiaceae bacterium]